MSILDLPNSYPPEILVPAVQILEGSIPFSEPADSTNVEAGQTDGGARVLVVDDEPGVRSLCAQALQTAGVQAEEAGSVPEAIAILEDGEVEIVLSDVYLPEVDELNLLHMIREYYPATSVPENPIELDPLNLKG